jgi:rod shape-determining protein MreB
MLAGLDKLLSDEVNLKVMHADDPLSCVALGTLKVLAELDLLAQIELNN